MCEDNKEPSPSVLCLLGRWLVFNCTKLMQGVRRLDHLICWPVDQHKQSAQRPLPAHLWLNWRVLISHYSRTTQTDVPLREQSAGLLKTGAGAGRAKPHPAHFIWLRGTSCPLPWTAAAIQCPRLPVIHMRGSTLFLCLRPRSHHTWPAK